MALNNTTASSSAYDGRIRCLPREKDGPYTCPRCFSECATPQKYASHVRCAHHKYETEAERSERMMAKKRGKSGVQPPRQGVVTAVAYDFSGEFVSAGNNVAAPPPPPPAMVKTERVELAEGVGESNYALAPTPGMALEPDAGVKIKVEVKDEY